MERPRGGREKKRSTFLVLVVGTLLNSHCGVAIVQYPLVVLLPRKKVKHETLRKTASVERGGGGRKKRQWDCFGSSCVDALPSESCGRGTRKDQRQGRKSPKGGHERYLSLDPFFGAFWEGGYVGEKALLHKASQKKVNISVQAFNFFCVQRRCHRDRPKSAIKGKKKGSDFRSTSFLPSGWFTKKCALEGVRPLRKKKKRKKLFLYPPLCSDFRSQTECFKK